MFKNPTLSTKKLQLQLINTWIQTHDLTCDCNNPGFHVLQIAAKQIGPELKPQDKQQIIKCLGETSTTDAAADTDPDIALEDLEALFAEDGDSEKDTTR